MQHNTRYILYQGVGNCENLQYIIHFFDDELVLVVVVEKVFEVSEQGDGIHPKEEKKKTNFAKKENLTE